MLQWEQQELIVIIHIRCCRKTTQLKKHSQITKRVNKVLYQRLPRVLPGVTRLEGIGAELRPRNNSPQGFDGLLPFQPSKPLAFVLHITLAYCCVWVSSLFIWRRFPNYTWYTGLQYVRGVWVWWWVSNETTVSCFRLVCHYLFVQTVKWGQH
jgi:hypothetical protein